MHNTRFSLEKLASAMASFNISEFTETGTVNSY